MRGSPRSPAYVSTSCARTSWPALRASWYVPAVLPNDVFKRPGPHHAHEVDRARLTQLRAAFEELQLLGDAGTLAALLDQQPELLLREAYRLSMAYTYCLIDADFGLRYYGPMFSRMGIATALGDPLIQQHDARVEPVSHVWFELSPYLPQRVAPAKDIYRELERELSHHPPPHGRS